MKKFFRRALTALLIVAGLFTATIVGAAVQMFDGKGEWHTSDAETEQMAKARASQRAQLDAQKKAGVYMKTFSRTVNLELAEDEITAVTNNIIEIVGEVHFDKQIIPLSNSQTTILYVATLKAKIDPDGLYSFVKRDKKDKVKIVERNNDLQDAIQRNDELAASLTEQYNRATTQAERDKIRKQMTEVDRDFLANQKFEEGTNLYYDKDYDGAIKLFNEALELNPSNETVKLYLYEALFERGKDYLNTGKYELALQDYTQAVKVDNDSDSDWQSYKNYLFRGVSYGACKQYDLAIEDFNRSIEFWDDDYAAYFTRGTVYFFLEQYGQAIQDLDKAVELFDKAFSRFPEDDTLDFIKSDAVAMRFVRSLVNQALGEEEKARADFTKIREFDPTGETIRKQIEILYRHLGNKKAQDILKNARQLGYKD